MKPDPSRYQQVSVSHLGAHLGYWMRFVSNHVSHGFARKVEAEGVTVSEWVILRQLYDAEQTSPSELAIALGMTKGAISKLMARLQAKGLLMVAVARDDRRRQVAQLTRKGSELVPRLADLADQNDNEFFGHMTKGARRDLELVLRALVKRHGLNVVPVQ